MELDNYLTSSTNHSTSYELSKQKIIYIKKREEINNELTKCEELKANLSVLIDIKNKEINGLESQANDLLNEIQKVRGNINSLIDDCLKRSEGGIKIKNKSKEAA